MRLFALLLAALLLAGPAVAQRDNNVHFRASDLDVQEWIKRLENPTRDVIAHRAGVIAALGLKPGQHVADVGAGTGPYMEGIARAVGPGGHYYGVDIAPGFIFHMRNRAAEMGANYVQLTMGRSAAERPRRGFKTSRSFLTARTTPPCRRAVST